MPSANAWMPANAWPYNMGTADRNVHTGFFKPCSVVTTAEEHNRNRSYTLQTIHCNQ